METKNTYVRARIDPRLKRETERILERLGLTTTEAIRLFLVQVRLRKGLPFRVDLENHREKNDDLLMPATKRQAALDTVYDD